jgi:hypothetical protein
LIKKYFIKKVIHKNAFFAKTEFFMEKEEFLALAASRYDELQELGKLDNFYDYEKSFDAIWQDLGRACLERSLQEETSNSSDRRKKKKTLTKFGYVTVSKSHKYMESTKNGFGISPLMQELMTFAGHLDCYEKCDEILEHFLSVKVNSSQVYRVTNYVSEQLVGEDEDERLLPAVAKDEVLYVEADGSMLSTREEGWKEVKLARLFKSSDCLNPNTESAYLTHSQYVAHFGNSKEFCEKSEKIIDSYGYLKSRLVFITDGALWIKNWIEISYPQSIAILDYYHACEHLHNFVENAMKTESPEFRKKWIEIQKELLLESSVKQVIKNIEQTNAKTSEKEKLINYYQTNMERMDYKSYRQLGCGIIGSGAIESAHRTVIQRRMKLSGQHWSKEGATNMLRLRVISMNKQWNKVINLVRTPPARAA